MKRPAKSPTSDYWPNAFIAIAQVFLGVAAGTLFTGNLDQYRISVVILNLITSAAVFYIGRKMDK